MRQRGGTAKTVNHDHAGNLVDDGTFVYVYDAWNHLVKVQSSKEGGTTVAQTTEDDGPACNTGKRPGAPGPPPRCGFGSDRVGQRRSGTCP